MAYTKQTWIDGDTTKPLSAARMNYIEDGIASNVATQSADYYIWKPEGGQIKAVPRVGSALPAIPDGTFTAVMQAAVNNLTVNTGARGASGGKIHIARANGADVYFFNNEVVINGWESIAGNNGVPESQLIIEGDGATTLVQNSAGQNGFVVKNLASVVFKDFGMYCGASAKSGILGDDTGTISPMSFWRGGLYNLLLRSNSTVAAPLHIKNQFSISGDQVIVQSSANHGVVFENNHAQTSFGNSHFGFISSSAASAAPYAAFRFISSNSAKPMNLMTIEHMESVDDCYYGAYFKGASWIKVNFADLEAQTYNVYLDGDASFKSSNIHFAGGYFMPKDTTGTGVYSSANSGATRIEGVYIETIGGGVPINDQNLYQSPSFYDIQIFAVADWARAVFAATNKHTVRVGTVNADTINRLAGAVTAPTVATTDNSTNVATTAFVKKSTNALTKPRISASTFTHYPGNGSGFGALSGTALYQQAKLRQRVAKAGRNVTLEFLTVNGPAEAGLGGDGSNLTYRAAIEYPAGTFYPAYNNDGNRDVVVTPNGGIGRLSVPGFEVPANQDWWVRLKVTGTVGGVIPYTVRVNDPTEWAIGPNSTATDYTTTNTGAPANGAGNPGYSAAPTLISYQPYDVDQASVVLIGDSITAGHGDDAQSVAYFTSNPGGWAVRALSSNGSTGRTSPGASHLQLACGSELAQNWLGTKGKSRLQLIDDTDIKTAWVSFTNDIFSNTLAQTQSDTLALWTMLANRGIKVTAFTVTPRSSSTDNWATTVNQTATAGNRVPYNQWLRAGAPINSSTKAAVAVGTGGALLAGQAGHPVSQIVDVCPAVETATDSGIWKVTGTAFAYTVDGTHPSTTGHTAMAAIARAQAYPTII